MLFFKTAMIAAALASVAAMAHADAAAGDACAANLTADGKQDNAVAAGECVRGRLQ